MIQNGARSSADPMFRAIVGVTILLAAIHAGLFLGGKGRHLFLAVSWFATWGVPISSSFLALAAFSVAILAFGRYQALREPTSYWTGAAFSVAGVGFVFWTLSWPFLPHGQPLVGHSSSTPTRIAVIWFTVFGACLLAAVLARRPRDGDLSAWRWPCAVAIWIMMMATISIAAIGYERSLPALVVEDASFTPALLVWMAGLAALYGAGGLLSLKHYMRSGDTLLAYLSMVQISNGIIMVTGVVTGRRNNSLFVIDRTLLIAAFLTVLFGLLIEYAGLLRREREGRIQLQERSVELLAILESIPEAVIVTDRAGKTRFASARGGELEGAPDVRAILSRVAAGESLNHQEMLLRLKEGDPLPVVASGGPLPACDGRREGALLVLADITGPKRMEEQTRMANAELDRRVRARTAQLEAANRELETFAYSVSHDLRAPLRGIDGWSLALLEDYASQMDEQARRYVERVRSEAQRMGTLIDDLLELSRVTRAQMESSTVDLSSLARGVAARLVEAHPNRSLEFDISSGLTTTGDARLLEVAVTNLLSNAVKFSGPRAATRIVFGQTESNGERPFYVRDNGVGFDMAGAGTLFGAFQRLHKASEFPGSGIGLATAQRIIQRHGGRIWAESQPEKGATFYFTVGSL